MNAVFALARTLAFLTRLPHWPRAYENGPHPLGRDAALFPLAGLIAALPSAGVLLLSSALGLSPLVGAAISVLLMVTVTGALHEDGLGDTADGLFGHHGRERALLIMKDSRIGTYGALALFGGMILRIALLSDIGTMNAASAALALLAAAAVSRGAMAWLWSCLPTADPGGLADSVGRPGRREGATSALIGLGLLVVLGGLGLNGWGIVCAGVFTAATTILFRRMLKRRLGGQTGDTLGALQQIAEIMVLLGLALAA